MDPSYDDGAIETFQALIKSRGINFTLAIFVEAAEDTGHLEEAQALDNFVLRRSDMTPLSWS